MLSVLALVLGFRVVTLALARVFTKVESASLDELMFVLDLGVSALVIREVSGRLHETSGRGAERHVGIWWTLDSVGVLANSVGQATKWCWCEIGRNMWFKCSRGIDEGAHD